MDIQAAIASLSNTQAETYPFSEVESLIGSMLSSAIGESTASKETSDATFQQLEAAAQAGEQNIFRALVAAEAKSREDNTPTILMAAVMVGKTEVVRSLVAAGADVNVRIEQFFTFDAMDFAVSKEYPDIVRILIEAGADLSWQAPFFPSVYAAIEKGNLEILKILLEADAEIVFKSKLSLLDEAVKHGNNPSLVKLLLDAGCDANAADRSGNTALVNACLHGRDFVVPLLLNAGADPNKPRKDGVSPIFAAFCIPRMTQTLARLGLGRDDATVKSQILMTVAQTQMLAIVKALVERGAKINVGQFGGALPLTLAAEHNYLEIVQLLIVHGVDVNAVEDPLKVAVPEALKPIETCLAKRHDRKTALLYAAEKGNTAIVAALLDAGADVAIADKLGQTPLDIAIREGYTDIIVLLQQAGAIAPAGATQFSKEAFMGAAKQGNLEVLQSALSAGINPNASEPTKGRDVRYKTALMFAAERGHLEAAQILLEAGADVDLGDRPNKKLGKTPLMFAAEANHYEVVRQLLEAGATVNAQDKRGPSALLNAVQHNATESVKILLEAGAEPHQKSWDGTPFEAANYSNEAIAKLMTAAEHGKNNAVSNAAREEMFCSAAFSGNLNIVRSLIQEGVNLDAADAESWTALINAASQGRLDIAQFLLASGANVNATSHCGTTALSISALSGYADIMKLLIAAGANLDMQKIEDGWTPLMGTLTFNQVETAQTLLEAGADPNIRNNDGKTALDLALADGKMAIAQLLRQAGALEGDSHLTT
jgi:ankyrin repeat protein